MGNLSMRNAYSSSKNYSEVGGTTPTISYVPTGRVVKLNYRDAQPKLTQDTSTFDVHFHAPDGEYYRHTLPNTGWSVENPTLQFLALNNMKPSDIDGTAMNVEDRHWLAQLAVTEEGFLLHGMELSGGRGALENAEWFSPHDDEESDSGQSQPIGGGSDSDGGGQVGVKLADEDSDSGVTVEIE